jgi:predicted RNase H-like HicB family nuclease
MPVLYFPAFFERAPDGYAVYFPDVPGCVSHGDNSAHAAAMAEEALALHINGMVEDGDEIPTPTPMEDAVPDPESESPLLSLVRVAVPGRSSRVNITMDDQLLEKIDARAGKGQRSAFLAKAARALLGESGSST